MELISTTAFNQAARCLKLYEYANVAHLIPRHGDLPPKIRKGIWAHKALEVHHSGGDWTDAIEDLYIWCVNHGVPEEQLGEIAESVEKLIDNYIAYWSTHDDILADAEVISHEKAYTLEVPKYDAQLRATVDMIVKLRRGIYIIEHKSTTNIPDADWRASDPQTMMQLYLAQKNGIKPQGVIFNYLLTKEPPVPQVLKNLTGFYANTAQTTTAAFNQAWPKIRDNWRGDFGEMEKFHDEMVLKYVNDNLWFQRYDAWRPEGHLKQTLKDLLMILRNLQACREAGHYPRSFHVFLCPQFCSYSGLCLAEYQEGRVLTERRETGFILDTGEREGR